MDMSGTSMHPGSNDRSGSSMQPGKGRSRMVTFRVSAEEFDLLTRTCFALGARSLSGFAREAVLDKVEAARSPSVTLSGDLTTLAKSLAELDSALREASGKIRHILGPAGDTGPKDMDPGR
jgi:hypothetical protein